MGGAHHAGSGAQAAANRRNDGMRAGCIHIGCGFIQQKHGGLEGQARCQSHPLAFSSGKGIPSAGGKNVRLCEAHSLHGVGICASEAIPPTSQTEPQGDIAEHGFFYQIGRLKQKRDFPTRIADIAEITQAAGTWLFQKGEQAQQGGFTAPVISRKCDDLAAFHTEEREVESDT